MTAFVLNLVGSVLPPRIRLAVLTTSEVARLAEAGELTMGEVRQVSRLEWELGQR